MKKFPSVFWISWSGEVQLCVWLFIEKVLSPFSAPKVARIEYTTWQWDFWEFSGGNGKIGKNFGKIFRKDLFSSSFLGRGMLGNFVEEKKDSKNSWENWMLGHSRWKRERADKEILEKIICCPAAPFSKTLLALLLLLHCRWICRGWAAFSCSRAASPPCKSPAFSPAPLNFHLFPAAK